MTGVQTCALPICIDRLKYLEISYNPKTLKVTSDFEWNKEESEFIKSEVDKEVEAINS